MSWEEETLVEKLATLFRSRGYPYGDAEARRKRSVRMRYFLIVFGAMHWADRVSEHRNPVARRGHISL